MPFESPSGGILLPDWGTMESGQRVADRYELQEQIAKGGFAVVWRAHDSVLHKDVALKVLRREMMETEGAVASLRDEVLRSLELSHENIVRIYDFVLDSMQDVAAISMEYIDGQTLSALTKAHPNGCLDPADIREWVGQACDALDYAHSERGGKKTVIHHDLKPGNFMVDDHGVLKILDFGISKSMAETQFQHTGQFLVMGTPPYMSPQQLRGSRPAPTDDVYSLGATIYALLTGMPPFLRGDIQLQVQQEIPPSIAERRDELDRVPTVMPPNWEETIAACLAKDVEARPPSVREVAVLLGVREPTTGTPRSVVGAPPAPGDAATAGTSVLGGGSPAPTMVVEDPSTGPAAAPNRTGLWVALGALAIAGGAGAAWWMSRESAPSETARSELARSEMAPVERPRAEDVRPADPAAPREDPIGNAPAGRASEPDPVVVEKEAPPNAEPEQAATKSVEGTKSVEEKKPVEVTRPVETPKPRPAPKNDPPPERKETPPPVVETKVEPEPEPEPPKDPFLEYPQRIQSSLQAGSFAQARRLLGELRSAKGGAHDTLVEPLVKGEVRAFLASYREARQSLSPSAYRGLFAAPDAEVESVGSRMAQFSSLRLDLEPATFRSVALDRCELQFEEHATMVHPQIGERAGSRVVDLTLTYLDGRGWRILTLEGKAE